VERIRRVQKESGTMRRNLVVRESKLKPPEKEASLNQSTGRLVKQGTQSFQISNKCNQ
jgi:hypothetical protein